MSSAPLVEGQRGAEGGGRAVRLGYTALPAVTVSK